MNIIGLIFILCLVLAALILSQRPKQESLATAFNGEHIYKNRVELIIKRATFVIAFLIAVILVLWQYTN